MAEKLLSVETNNCCLKSSQLVDFRYLSGMLELIFSSNEENKIRVVFDWIHSFRVADEGDLLKMQSDLNGQMLTGIYTVENSNYLLWFNEQSANIHDG